MLRMLIGSGGGDIEGVIVMAVMVGDGMGICLKQLELRLAFISIMELGAGLGLLLQVGYMMLHLGDAIVSHVPG